MGKLKLVYIAMFSILMFQGEESEAVYPAQLIPPTFPNQDLSQYTFRYISKDGNDSNSCLTNQTFSENNTPSTEIQYCRTLLFALTENLTAIEAYHRTNLVLFVLPGDHLFGSRGVEIYGSNSIILTKLPSAVEDAVLSCVEYDDTEFNNLYLVNSTNIAIQGLVFTLCGPRSPAVRVRQSRAIFFTDCEFRNNFNNGVFLGRSFDTHFTNCRFHDNNSTARYRSDESDHLDPGDLRFAGGLGFLWRNVQSETLTIQATIRNCTFFSNNANVNAQNANDTRPSLYRPRGHGGGLVLSFNRTVNFKIVIEDTTFANNTALYYGGGIFISFYRDSSSNVIMINNSRFEGNECQRTGGGISINTFQGSNENTINVDNCTFERNSASVGGGGCSINLQDQLVAEGKTVRNNTAKFNNCTFRNNESPRGSSAVALLANTRVDQAVVATTFTNCTFLSNSGEQSAIWSFRFPISLRGTNIIKNNSGGGVTLLQSPMDVKGSVWFEGNTAVEGGAVALQDQSVLHLHRNVNITFIGNSAITRGGAISVESPTVGIDTDVIRLFNTRCFIQYEVGVAPLSTDPANWNVSLVFINNTAGRGGAAIYATDIGRCTYTPTLNVSKEEKEFSYGSSIFRVYPQFTFSGNQVLGESSTNIVVEDIATAPSNLIISPEVVFGAPGERITFDIRAVDESGNSKPAVWSISDHTRDEPEHTDDEDDELVNFFSLFAGGNEQGYELRALRPELYPNCSNGLTRTLNFSLLQVISGDVSSISAVNVNLSCCHPAYNYNEATGVCVHNHNLSIVVRPDAKKHYIYIKPKIYAEVRDGEIVSAVMPPTFQNCSRVGTLSGCLFRYDHPDEQCSENRTGFLCGQCPPGKGVDLTLLQCADCTAGAAIIVAFIVVVFSIASVLVLIFNIGIPNELKGCLFFVQVVGFVYHSQADADSIAWDFHLSRVFGFSFYLPLCPYPGYRALPTTAYGLLLPLIAIVILTLYILSARIIRPLSHRSSFEGIWLLSIITYKYLADTCFNILRCQKVTGASDEYVYYYDGTVRCFHSALHIGFAVFALVTGVFVILLFPVVILVISFKRFKLTQPFTDVLSRGIKSSCRWWSSFDLFRRLLFIFVVFFFNYISPTYIQFALFFAGLLVFFIFACAQPYEAMKDNIIEAAVLLDLLLLTAVFLDTDTRNLDIILPYAQMLLLLPFISLVLYIAALFIGWIWAKVSPTSFTMCVRKIRNLLHGSFSKQHHTLSHTLDKKEENGDSTQLIGSTQRESAASTDVEELSEFQAEYSVFREELLEEGD